jgi:hypothetical protein
MLNLQLVDLFIELCIVHEKEREGETNVGKLHNIRDPFNVHIYECVCVCELIKLFFYVKRGR